MERYGMVWFRSSWVSLMCGLLHGEWNEISTLFFSFPFLKIIWDEVEEHTIKRTDDCFTLVWLIEKIVMVFFDQSQSKRR